MLSEPADPFRPHGWVGDVRGDPFVYRSVQWETPGWPMRQASPVLKGAWTDRDQPWPAQCDPSAPGERKPYREHVPQDRVPVGVDSTPAGAGIGSPRRAAGSGGWWRGRGGSPGAGPVRVPRGGSTGGPAPGARGPITPNPSGTRFPGLPPWPPPAPLPGAPVPGGPLPFPGRGRGVPAPGAAAAGGALPGHPITPNPGGTRFPGLPGTTPGRGRGREVPPAGAWGAGSSPRQWSHWRGLRRFLLPSVAAAGASGGGGRPIPGLS